MSPAVQTQAYRSSRPFAFWTSGSGSGVSAEDIMRRLEESVEERCSNEGSMDMRRRLVRWAGWRRHDETTRVNLDSVNTQRVTT